MAIKGYWCYKHKFFTNLVENEGEISNCPVCIAQKWASAWKRAAKKWRKNARHANDWAENGWNATWHEEAYNRVLERERDEARAWAGKLLNERNWWRSKATEELTRRILAECKLGMRKAKNEVLAEHDQRIRTDERALWIQALEDEKNWWTPSMIGYVHGVLDRLLRGMANNA